MRGEPFAFHVYREHLKGRTIQQLAAEFEIPAARIEQRVRAAASYAATLRGALHDPGKFGFQRPQLSFEPFASGSRSDADG